MADHLKTVDACFVGILLAASNAAAAGADAGKWLSGHANRPAPLVVMLQGCAQSPETFTESTE